MESLNYETLQNEVISILESAQEIVFATSSEDRVTARTMNHINMGLTIMFGTKRHSEKVAQLKKNKNVAFVTGNVQIEAVAELSGHPDNFPDYTAKFVQKFPGLGAVYPSTPEDVVISATPTKITLFKFLEKPYHDVLDVAAHKAYRIAIDL